MVTLQLGILLNFLISHNQAWGASTKARPTEKSHARPSSLPSFGPKPKLSTDMNFNDLTVSGSKQSPLGLTTTIENEKDIPRLIDFRSDFRDRVKQSATGR